MLVLKKVHWILAELKFLSIIFTSTVIYKLLIYTEHSGPFKKENK